jgi:hypothetical protein
MRNLFTILLMLVALAEMAGAQNQPAETSRYPNELPGFKLYAEGGWKSLEPWVSTGADAERVLGKPSPVFIPYNNDWQVIVNYFGSGTINGRPWGEFLKGTIDSISFYPRRRVSFSRVVFPRAFECEGIVVSHTPAPLMSCSDATGLSYLIYTGDSDDGVVRKGDLRKIEYGVSRERHDVYSNR